MHSLLLKLLNIGYIQVFLSRPWIIVLLIILSPYKSMEDSEESKVFLHY